MWFALQKCRFRSASPWKPLTMGGTFCERASGAEIFSCHGLPKRRKR